MSGVKIYLYLSTMYLLTKPINKHCIYHLTSEDKIGVEQ